MNRERVKRRKLELLDGGRKKAEGRKEERRGERAYLSPNNLFLEVVSRNCS